MPVKTVNVCNGVAERNDRSAARATRGYYCIESLNWDPEFTPRPGYPEKVNARIGVRISVTPEGRTVKRIPATKGCPELGKVLMNTLQRRRFKWLPSDAAQQDQTRTITLAFR